MSRIRKQGLRDLAAMALAGTPQVEDPGVVLALSLEQLRLGLHNLVSALELGGVERDELQGNLIGLQYRCEALQNFSDECLSVSFLPLGDEGDAETAVAS